MMPETIATQARSVAPVVDPFEGKRPEPRPAGAPIRSLGDRRPR